MSVKDLVAHILYEGVYDEDKSEYFCTELALEADFHWRGITHYEVYEIRLGYDSASGKVVAMRKRINVT